MINISKDYTMPEFLKYSAASLKLNTNTTNSASFIFSLPKIKNAIYFCTSFSLPGMNCPELVYTSGRGGNYKVPGSEVTHGDLSFSYLVDEKLTNYEELVAWFSNCVSVNSDPNNIYKNWMSEEGQLLLLSSKKKIISRVTFRGLFPIKLSGGSFNSADVDATSVIATCNMGFTYYNVENYI